MNSINNYSRYNRLIIQMYYWRTQGFATKRLHSGGSSDLAEPGDLQGNSIVTHAVGSRAMPAGIRCQKEAEGKV